MTSSTRRAPQSGLAAHRPLRRCGSRWWEVGGAAGGRWYRRYLYLLPIQRATEQKSLSLSINNNFDHSFAQSHVLHTNQNLVNMSTEEGEANPDQLTIRVRDQVRDIVGHCTRHEIHPTPSRAFIAAICHQSDDSNCIGTLSPGMDIPPMIRL